MERPDQTPGPSIPGAIALIVVGLVIFVPTGLCTGVLLFGPFVEALVQPHSTFSSEFSIVPLVIGGPFVFAGGYLIWRGARTILARLRK